MKSRLRPDDNALGKAATFRGEDNGKATTGSREATLAMATGHGKATASSTGKQAQTIRLGWHCFKAPCCT